VAIYSITLIGLFLVVAQIFFLPLAPWSVFLQKAVLLGKLRRLILRERPAKPRKGNRNWLDCFASDLLNSLTINYIRKLSARELCGSQRLSPIDGMLENPPTGTLDEKTSSFFTPLPQISPPLSA